LVADHSLAQGACALAPLDGTSRHLGRCFLGIFRASGRWPTTMSTASHAATRGAARATTHATAHAATHAAVHAAAPTAGAAAFVARGAPARRLLECFDLSVEALVPDSEPGIDLLELSDLFAVELELLPVFCRRREMRRAGGCVASTRRQAGGYE